MPRTLRLPSGPQRLALASGHDAVFMHPDFAPQARRAEVEPGLISRLAQGSADMLEALTDAVRPKAERDDWAPEIPEWADGGERTRSGFTLIDNVALIEIEGVLMSRGFEGWFSGCYWPGYRDYVAAVRAANEDERVDAILLRFDTPGGYVAGCAEAAQALRSLNQSHGGKPLIGHADELCASAGMKLAAQCDGLYASDGAMIGSVGVRIGFFDFEGALERWGERSHIYKSGRLKDMGSPLRAPTDEESAIYQAEVDHLADRFYVELALGRGLDLEAVRESRGWEARTFTAGDPPPPAELDPLAVDLIDAVMTEQDAFAIAQSLAGTPAAVNPPNPVSVSAAASRAASCDEAEQGRSVPAAGQMETPMSLKAKMAALAAKASGGDANAQAELDGIRALIAAHAETEDDADAMDGEDEDAANGEGEGEDDAEAAEDEDEDAANAEGEDEDVADAEDGEDDDAEARADKILNSAEAKGREALAGKLAVKVAGGKLTPAEALDMLKTSPKGESNFRKSASAYTPKGAKPGSGAGSGAPKGSGADALLSQAHKSLSAFRN
jgi:ClpP class serine protease